MTRATLKGRWFRLGTAVAVLAAAVTLPLAFGAMGGAAPPPVPVKQVYADPFEDGQGYHGSAEEPSIIAAKNPARATGPAAGNSTIVATQQVGRVYDGGSSDIGYEVSVDGGKSWKQGNMPLTVQGGQADTCAGSLNRASDTVTAYDAKHDIWLVSTLGLSGNADVPAVYVNRGKANFKTKDIDWDPPICTHITQPAADSPDKNWITCDNWPTSKGFGTCYEEYDNNGNGNRLLMQWTDDSGLTWHPAPNLNTNPAFPGNGNTGDVSGETTLAAPASPGDTNVKVGSVAGIGTTLAAASAAGDSTVKVTSVTPFFATTLSAAANAGDTNIKVASVTALFPGASINVDRGAGVETRTIATVGTAGATGTGVTLTTALAAAHASGAAVTPAGQTINVDTGAGLETRTIQAVGTAGAAGTGLALTSPLANAHPSGAQVNDAQVNVDIDASGGNQETVNVLSVGTAAFSTTLAAAANAGDTNIKVASVTGLTAGRTLTVDAGSAGQETVTVTVVGTAGAAGTGVTFTPALASPHATAAIVSDLGNGITFSPALTKSHVQGAPTASVSAPPAGRTGGIGGVPLVQPPPPGAAPGTKCGRVVVPIQVNGVSYFSSSDCGLHWSATTQILPNMTATHSVPQMRTSLLPTSAMDGAGNIYVVWQTRSFRVGSVASTPNDIALTIMGAPTDAKPYPPFGAPARIPIEADNTNANTNDHFIPGIAADPNTSGDSAHLALFYYNLPIAACVYADPANVSNQCQLRVGYVSSTDGGDTWSDPLYLASMGMPDLVRSSQGLMVGDYSTADVIPAGPNAGNAVSAFAVGQTDETLNQPMYVPKDGIPIPFTPGTHGKQKATPAAIAVAKAEGVQRHPNVPPSVP
jgi:hypothetical protein